MVKLYLFRHGEVEGAEARVFNGHRDVSLSVRGVRQFEEIAKKMRGEKIDAVYGSDLSRSSHGATMIGAPHFLKPVCLSAIREINFGEWDGLGVDEVCKLYPDEMNRRAGNLLNHRIKNGETLYELKERVVSCFEGIVSNHDGGTIACVGHGGVNRVLILWALKSPLSALYSLRQDYGCMNIINFHQGGHIELEQMNVSLS